MNALSYSPRLVKAFPPLYANGRTLKVYGIFADPNHCSMFPPMEALSEHTASVLREPLKAEDHGLGFLILHFAMDGNYLLVSQWYDANMLRHWVRGSMTDTEGNMTFVPLAQRDLIACVWELEVIKFERDAWVRTVLTRGQLDRTGIQAYLTATFSGWV